MIIEGQMKRVRRERLEQKKAMRRSQQLPQWLLQGEKHVMAHFETFIDKRAGVEIPVKEFKCSECRHFVERECEGKGYEGKKVFECLQSHKCSFDEVLETMLVLHFPSSRFSCRNCVDNTSGVCTGRGYNTMRECVECMREKLSQSNSIVMGSFDK
jgi:hypothetical protein